MPYITDAAFTYTISPVDCPNCGSPPKVIRNRSGCREWTYGLICPTCKALSDTGIGEDSLPEAIKEWNQTVGIFLLNHE